MVGAALVAARFVAAQNVAANSRAKQYLLETPNPPVVLQAGSTPIARFKRVTIGSAFATRLAERQKNAA